MANFIPCKCGSEVSQKFEQSLYIKYVAHPLRPSPFLNFAFIFKKIALSIRKAVVCILSVFIYSFCHSITIICWPFLMLKTKSCQCILTNPEKYLSLWILLVLDQEESILVSRLNLWHWVNMLQILDLTYQLETLYAPLLD